MNAWLRAYCFFFARFVQVLGVFFCVWIVVIFGGNVLIYGMAAATPEFIAFSIGYLIVGVAAFFGGRHAVRWLRTKDVR